MIKIKAFFGSALMSVALVVFGAAQSFAEQTVYDVQRDIEERVRPIIRGFDSNAIVFVTVKSKKEDKNLPVTPFVVKDLSLRNTEGGILIQEIEITVLTSEKEIPENISKLVEAITSNYGVKPKMTIEPLPQELKGGSLPGEPVASQPGWFSFGVIALGLACLAIMFFYLQIKRKESQSFTEAIDAGISKIVSAFEEKANTEKPKKQQDDEARQRGAGSFQGIPGRDLSRASVFEKLTEESLTALLMDCYWSEEDQYAAFIWKRVSFDRRKILTSKNEYLSDYAKHIRTLSERDLGMDQEPYYLKPLPIWQYDNKELTALVQKNKNLYLLLPPLRTQHLDLSVKEKIELVQAVQSGKKTAAAVLPDFSKSKASEKRKFKTQIQIKIKTLDEELEVLAMKDLHPEIKKEIPTLGWLLEFRDEQIAEIFKAYTARDLASAWIGPSEVLEKLAQQIPDKKRALMESYLSQSTPSRSSSTYLSIHKKIVQEWEKKETHVEDQPQNIQKAA